MCKGARIKHLRLCCTTSQSSLISIRCHEVTFPIIHATTATRLLTTPSNYITWPRDCHRSLKQKKPSFLPFKTQLRTQTLQALLYISCLSHSVIVLRPRRTFKHFRIFSRSCIVRTTSYGSRIMGYKQNFSGRRRHHVIAPAVLSLSRKHVDGYHISKDFLLSLIVCSRNGE